jgi:hypothetical protein
MKQLTHAGARRIGLLLAAAGCVVALSQQAATQTHGRAEHFTSAAVDMNTGQTGRIEISVDRWSTESERTTLLNALFKEGQSELLKVLSRMRAVGRIYSTSSIGYELRYAQQRPLPDGGREIIVATDRPMSFWEVRGGGRTTQYPFTWAQLQMRADGTGEGKLAVAARIIGDEADRLIEVEDYAIHPVRLQSVKMSQRD